MIYIHEDDCSWGENSRICSSQTLDILVVLQAEFSIELPDSFELKDQTKVEFVPELAVSS